MGANGAIIDLIKGYHELNPALVDELAQKPTALQFMRYVARNRPFVVRGAASNWDAVLKWSPQYLRQALEGQKVKVAITPNGNADAVVEDELGRLLFVEPYEQDESFDAFLDYIEHDLASAQNRNVKYAQTQNGNLHTEYGVLASDVPSDIDFAKEALEKDVDAVNFWLGNDRSTTSLHKDNYENIYIQIRGQKHFTLLPPIEMPCVNETPLQFARYRPSDSREDFLLPCINHELEPIPVPLWDPDEPSIRPTHYSEYSRAVKVSLSEGDMMYLPAMWYHKVCQESGAEGFSCSVNYWYDMEFSGSFWASNTFVRDIYNRQLKAVVYPDLVMGAEKTHDPNSTEPQTRSTTTG